MEKSFVVLLIFLSLVLFGLNLFVCKIPPDDLTKNHITRLKVRITDYYTKNRTLPSDIKDLPPDDPRYAGSLKDGWGNPIRYTVVNAQTVTLSSFGKDNLLGGKDVDSDISETFELE